MNAIKQFRDKMRALGYTEEEIQDDINNMVEHVRMNRRAYLLEDLEKAGHAMTDDELKALKGGEL